MLTQKKEITIFNSKKKIVAAVLAVFAVMSAFCAPAFCLDQITIDFIY